jgi:hypothetical protein
MTVCLFSSYQVAMRMQARQKKWAVATQGRLHAVSSTISGIKSVKSLGLDDKASSRILKLRQLELAEATKFRRLEIWANAIGKKLCVDPNPAHELEIRTDSEQQASC